MKLVINSGSVFKGGAEQVALSFIYECRNFPGNEYHVIIAPNLKSQINYKDFPDNFEFHLIEKRPAINIFYFFRMMRWYNQFEKRIKPDCVISTGGHGYWRPKVSVVGGFNIAHFIYPESHFFSNLPLKKIIYWRLMKFIHRQYYNRLDAVLVQTEDVENRLKTYLSSRIPIYFVSNTINGNFIESKKFQNKLPDRINGETRLLTLSSYYPHKNLEVIKPVVKVLEDYGFLNFRFIVTLPENIFQDLFGEVKTGMIINIGPIPIKECPSLYRECDFMFLPTFLECFSASYVEAMIMRKPILTSDMSFSRTVCRDAALYFDPMDVNDIADKIITLSKDIEMQKIFIQRGIEIFKSINSPNERARKFLEICEHTSNASK